MCHAVMSVTVLLMSLLVERLWVVLPKSPYFASLYSLGLTFGIMMFGGVIAFFMVRLHFICCWVVQCTSLRVNDLRSCTSVCSSWCSAKASVITMAPHACAGVDGVQGHPGDISADLHGGRHL